MSEWRTDQFLQLRVDELASIRGAADGAAPIGTIATEGDAEFRAVLNGTLKTGQLQAQYKLTKNMYGDLLTEDGKAMLDQLNGRIERRMNTARILWDRGLQKIGRF